MENRDPGIILRISFLMLVFPEPENPDNTRNVGCVTLIVVIGRSLLLDIPDLFFQSVQFFFDSDNFLRNKHIITF